MQIVHSINHAHIYIIYWEGECEYKDCPSSSHTYSTHTHVHTQGMQEYYRGQYDSSTKTEKKAKRWVIASVVTGITFTVVLIMSVLLIHAVTWGLIYGNTDGSRKG